ncbi:hypothetical protein [Maribacter sp. ACAM166]|uniref:hypothetical protein n=1 Tax=Maribacter sp. ACAM166 TaxID=2508996 RepID=UPI0010FF04E2|nr:hypothetical protein [Maribacter sp. ACAM166]TLP81774.1 hypothetical protein ES765_03575 [Maribacter sp. ACAM166]
MKRIPFIHLKPLLWSLLTIAILAGNNSCKRAAEKATEKIVEKSIGDEVEVDIDDEKVVIKTDEGTLTTDAAVKSWPNDIPDEVPEFKSGNIVSVTTQEINEDNNWVVIFEDVTTAALEKYKDALESEGFKINYTTTAGTSGHLAAEKEKLAVVVMVGEGNATVTVGKNN